MESLGPLPFAFIPFREGRLDKLQFKNRRQRPDLKFGNGESFLEEDLSPDEAPEIPATSEDLLCGEEECEEAEDEADEEGVSPV